MSQRACVVVQLVGMQEGAHELVFMCGLPLVASSLPVTWAWCMAVLIQCGGLVHPYMRQGACVTYGVGHISSRVWGH